MVDLNKALEVMKFDVRMRDFNLKHGSVKKEEIEKYMTTLNDSAAASEPVTLEDKEDFT